MGLPAGSAYYSEFTTANPTTGAAQNADLLPVATATRNGADDATFALTVLNLATGRYKVTGTIPAGYAAGDLVQVSVAATVATVAGVGIVDGFSVDALVSSRSTYAGADTAGTTTLLARLTAPRATNLDNLDAAVSTRSTYAGGPVASVTSPVTVGTITDKTGYVLAPGGLDAISTAAPTGPAATFREMVVATFRRWFGPSAKSAADGTITTYADDGATVVTTAFTDDGSGNETLGAAQ